MIPRIVLALTTLPLLVSLSSPAPGLQLPAGVRTRNAETGEALAVTGGRLQLRLPAKRLQVAEVY